MDTIENYKALQICKEMFQIRNYHIYEVDELHIKARMSNRQIIYLYIITAPKLNVDLMKYYYSILHTDNVKHCILVYQNNITSSVKKILQNIDIQVQLFCIDELKYNILNHVLVPKHTKVDRQAKNDKKYPILKKSDPVAKFMGYKPGDVIRIDRNDGTIYYRYVK